MRVEGAQAILTVTPDRVAQIGYDGFMRGKRVVVAGFLNKIAVALLRFTPHALLMPIVEQRMRGERDSS